MILGDNIRFSRPDINLNTTQNLGDDFSCLIADSDQIYPDGEPQHPPAAQQPNRHGASHHCVRLVLLIEVLRVCGAAFQSKSIRSKIRFPLQLRPRHCVNTKDADVCSTMPCGNELVHSDRNCGQRRHRPIARSLQH